MKTTCSRALVGVSVLIALGAGLAGCNHDLFVDHDTRSSQSLRFYDNDSATQTTEDRRQSAGMPFGLPQGSAAQ